MKKRTLKLMTGCLVVLLAFLLRTACVHAADTDTADGPETDTGSSSTVVLEEPALSDLKLLHADTVLDGDRWIQSFTKDNKYYYFVQMIRPEKGDLRVTRVKYTERHKYIKDHMDLLGFGHGTNIDCTRYRGKTYLWIGSRMDKKSGDTTAISCFRYIPNGVYKNKGGNTYRIRMKGSLRKAENVFPAVSQDGKYLYVRYTYQKRQYFQKYRIYRGNTIRPNRILMKLSLKKTPGDFQGFDVYKNELYTIEGSPTALFLSGYDASRKFQSTIIRITNMKTKSRRTKIISGASTLAFREPEGIKVSSKRGVVILFASNTLTKQRCCVYKVK